MTRTVSLLNRFQFGNFSKSNKKRRNNHMRWFSTSIRQCWIYRSRRCARFAVHHSALSSDKRSNWESPRKNSNPKSSLNWIRFIWKFIFRIRKGHECTATILDNYWLMTSKTCCLGVEEITVVYNFGRTTFSLEPNIARKIEHIISPDADICIGTFWNFFFRLLILNKNEFSLH